MKNKINRLLYLVVLSQFISCSNIFAQNEDNYTFKIDSLLNTKAERLFNGVVLITQNGIIKYSKVVGYSNFYNQKPLKFENQFEIMSNSKLITAVLILKEVEKGKINLTFSIKKYLPYLNQSWADTVTVNQLLNHTSGIVDIEKPLIFKPGSDFKYGNLSYILLGKIIEFVTKKPYSEVANTLFKSLKMQNTFCYSETQNYVFGHINKENVFKVVEKSQIKKKDLPANGIISNVKDLVIWNAKLHKNGILKPQSYKLLTTKSFMAQHNVFGKEKVGYGYGIRICENEKTKYIGHTGLGDGFASMNLYFPIKDLSIIVLENQMNDKIELCYHFEIEIKKIIQQAN